ncbi:MAG: hypothetical protein ACXABY_22985 [Candidatus Thorarchaeota archaeon]|jgi:hypothetical protein
MSSKPVPKKMFIKENYIVLLLNEPDRYRDLLIDLPEGVEVVASSSEPVDFVHLFVRDKAELEAHLEITNSYVKKGGLLWVSYPKGTSKIKTDINRDSIRVYSKTLGIRPVTQISIDDTWSAMRFKPIEE